MTRWLLTSLVGIAAASVLYNRIYKTRRGQLAIDRYTANSEVVLKRNPHYWGKPPQLDGARYVFTSFPRFEGESRVMLRYLAEARGLKRVAVTAPPVIVVPPL